MNPPHVFLDPTAPGCAFLDAGTEGDGTPLVCLDLAGIDALMTELADAAAGLLAEGDRRAEL